MTRSGHISRISRIRACKHKNLVIHINTRTWGQVSRYECLYCSTYRLGHRQSFYAVLQTTRLSMRVISLRETVHPRIADTKISLKDRFTGSNVFVLVDVVYLYEDANHVWPQASLEESSCESVLWYFQLLLKRLRSCSQLCNFTVRTRIIVLWNFTYFSYDHLGFLRIRETRNCIRYKLCEVAGSSSNIYILWIHKNANIWQVVHIFEVLV